MEVIKEKIKNIEMNALAMLFITKSPDVFDKDIIAPNKRSVNPWGVARIKSGLTNTVPL